MYWTLVFLSHIINLEYQNFIFAKVEKFHTQLPNDLWSIVIFFTLTPTIVIYYLRASGHLQCWMFIHESLLYISVDDGRPEIWPGLFSESGCRVWGEQLLGQAGESPGGEAGVDPEEAGHHRESLHFLRSLLCRRLKISSVIKSTLNNCVWANADFKLSSFSRKSKYMSGISEEPGQMMMSIIWSERRDIRGFISVTFK